VAAHPSDPEPEVTSEGGATDLTDDRAGAFEAARVDPSTKGEGRVRRYDSQCREGVEVVELAIEAERLVGRIGSVPTGTERSGVATECNAADGIVEGAVGRPPVDRLWQAAVEWQAFTHVVRGDVADL